MIKSANEPSTKSFVIAISIGIFMRYVARGQKFKRNTHKPVQNKSGRNLMVNSLWVYRGLVVDFFSPHEAIVRLAHLLICE